MPSPTMDKEARVSNSEQKDDIRKPLLQTEEVSNDKRPASFTNANTWRRMTFSWLNQLFNLGRSKTLELIDVPVIPDEDSACRSSLLLETALQKQKELSFPRAIFSTVWKPLAATAIFAGLTTISSYMGPLLITMLINVLASSDSSPAERSHGYVLALCLFFSKNIESFSQRHWYFGAQKIGIRVRAGLMVLIYRRALSMKCRCKSVGEMVNLMSVDVEKIGDFAWYFHGLWLLPIQISLALFILYINLGIAPSLAALLATIVIMVGNTPLANLQEKFHSKIMGNKDKRVKATAECLKFMRILKLQSWEALYMEKILKFRDTEKGWLRKYLYTCAAVAFLFWAAPTVVSVATFNVCILMGTPLTASKVFAALATFRILQEPIYNLPELLSMIAQTKVSLDRIASFVFEDEEEEEEEEEEERYFRVAGCNADMNVGVGEIDMKESGFSWEMYGEKPIITTINLQIKRGQKIAVCGSVGSGKSSLLLSILGEIHRVSGDAVKVSGSKAYVAQSAWIQTGTIRENILFGREKDDNLYSTVLRACALEKDLSSFAYGDQTLVGERGVNLSGGQKQRLQLARALYSNADVYLLDDPFSAVDAHTGSHLFKECLMGVLADRTVVYVTHQLEFLSTSDLVLGYYISTARELARMVNIRKAPILHHMSESVSGAATVRCFGQEERFLGKTFGLVDDYSSLVFHNFAAMEWLCLRINFLFNLAFLFVLIALVTLPRSQMDPSLAGLAATYGLNLNVLQAWVLWNLCNVENKMISVERILQFCNIASEAPLVIEDSKPEPQWPQKGTIEITDLYVRYSPHLPFVLQGVSCVFPGEKKIGIVGRTGSGKSTLIQALFRLVEPSSGTIRVDGVDIGMIGLQDLRTRMSIIPQDPSLFQGTLRSNLDPFQQYTDQAIREALNKCHLGNLDGCDRRSLDAPIDEDGGNWSVGQRQLLCLARALLKQRRIVVLDEVTASIDTATDHLIQKTIRQTTRNCTVITIAHRLPTVIDNDFVLVLHEGKVLEYDSPYQLLKDSSSAFSKLATEMSRRSKAENHPSTQAS